MPSEKILAQKQADVDALVARLKDSSTGIICDYKGISVENDTLLRRELRKADVEYTVVKNSILSRAAAKCGLEELSPFLVGTTSLATSKDPVAAAKILSKYAEKSKGAFSIKSGYIDGKVIDTASIGVLAKLPPKEVLIARVLGGFNAPITGLVNVLNANIRGLVIALNGILEKKSA